VGRKKGTSFYAMYAKRKGKKRPLEENASLTRGTKQKTGEKKTWRPGEEKGEEPSFEVPQVRSMAAKDSWEATNQPPHDVFPKHHVNHETCFFL